MRQGFSWHGSSEVSSQLVIHEMRTRLASEQQIAPGFRVQIALSSHQEVAAVVRRVDPGPPVRLRLEWEGGSGWRLQRDVRRIPGLQGLGTPQDLGCEVINAVGHGRLVCAASFFRQLRVVRGVELTSEEECALFDHAGVEGLDLSAKALDFAKASSLLGGEPEPEPEPEPVETETEIQLVRQNSTDERARRDVVGAELAAVLAATDATERELAEVQLEIERTQHFVEVGTWSDWDAKAAVAAADALCPSPLLFVKSKRGCEEIVGKVLKVDSHRVRVEWIASGKKQWTTKRDLTVGR